MVKPEQEVVVTGMGLEGPGLAVPQGAAAGRSMRGASDPTAMLLARCTSRALEQARLPSTGRLGPGFGVATGVTLAAVDHIMDLDSTVLRSGLAEVRPLSFPNTVLNAPAGRLAIAFGLTGPNATLATAEAGALDAMTYARDLICRGRAGGFVAGGAYAGSKRVENALRLAEKEGAAGGYAAMFVIEAADRARARGIPGLAQVSAAGAAFLPAGRDNEEIAARALQGLLRRAEVSAGEIEAVASGTSPDTTQAAVERAVIRRTFGPGVAAEPLAKKGSGRLLDAAGCLAAATAVSALTASPGPAHVLLMSFSGFGHASFLLLSCPDRQRRSGYRTAGARAPWSGALAVGAGPAYG